VHFLLHFVLLKNANNQEQGLLAPCFLPLICALINQYLYSGAADLILSCCCFFFFFFPAITIQVVHIEKDHDQNLSQGIRNCCV
jgi:hypothetical protein